MVRNESLRLAIKAAQDEYSHEQHKAHNMCVIARDELDYYEADCIPAGMPVPEGFQVVARFIPTNDGRGRWIEYTEVTARI